MQKNKVVEKPVLADQDPLVSPTFPIVGIGASAGGLAAFEGFSSGSNIATVFVDHQLRILRFTPTASEIINLIPSDTGRPVAHIVSNLTGYNRLVTDTQAVLDTLIPKEVEVQTTTGQWYTLRILPYRTEGAVLTFMEVTETVRARKELERTNELARPSVGVRAAHDAITVQDLESRTAPYPLNTISGDPE